MLIELGVVEQRHKAVLEVLAGNSVVAVAGRYGVSRQTLHRWLRRYARSGIGGLADASARPARCPHRTPPAVEARIVEMRLAHPRWGPRTIAHYLAREGARAPTLALLDLPLPGAPSPDRSPEAPSQARGLPSLGAFQGHGALADGRHGRRQALRRIRAQARQRHRRPLALLRLGPAGRARHHATGLRGTACGDAPSRRPRADPDRQRQGVHGALRRAPPRGALRPHLPRAGRASPAAAPPTARRRPARSSASTRRSGASSSKGASSPRSRRPRRSSTSG